MPAALRSWVIPRDPWVSSWLTPSYIIVNISRLIIHWTYDTLAEWLTRCPAKAVLSRAQVRILQVSIQFLVVCPFSFLPFPLYPVYCDESVDGRWYTL